MNKKKYKRYYKFVYIGDKPLKCPHCSKDISEETETLWKDVDVNIELDKCKHMIRDIFTSIINDIFESW